MIGFLAKALQRVVVVVKKSGCNLKMGRYLICQRLYLLMDIYKAVSRIKRECGGFDSRFFSDEYRNLLDTDAEKKLFLLLRNILSIVISCDDKGIKASPMFVMADGRRSFSMDDLDEKAYISLKELDIEKFPAEIRAHIGVVLWLGHREFEYARLAAESFRDMFLECFDPEEWTDCYDCIKKAIVLSSVIGDKDGREECLKLVFDKVVEINGGDRLFLSIRLVELLIDQKANCDYAVLISAVKKLLKNNISHRLESIYELLFKLYRKCKNKEGERAAHMDYARTLESFSGAHSTFSQSMQSVNYLKQAIKEYSNWGDEKDVNRVKKTLEEVERVIPGLMKSHEYRTDMSDTYEIIDEMYENLSFQEALIQLAKTVYIRKVDEIKKATVDNTRKNVFSSLAQKTFIDNDGHTVAKIDPLSIKNPEKDEELFVQHMINDEQRYEDLQGHYILRYQINKIEKMEFSVDDVYDIVSDSIIIPEGRSKIIAEGLYYGLKGEMYLSLHILVPQTEQIFRRLASECGDVVFDVKNNGIEQASMLKSVFELPNLNECCDESILFVFKGMMIEKSGSNIRNLIAHGLMDEPQAYSGNAVFFLCSLIRLILFSSRKVLLINNASDRLKMNNKTIKGTD